MRAHTIGVGGGSIPIVWDSGFRLTAETGVPVSTSDQANKTTIYFTPYKHGQIALWNDTSKVWEMITSPEVSLALGTLTADKNYDVFASADSNGALSISLGDAWTSDTARSTALVRKDGVLVKSATAPGYRYVGTIRTSSTTQTQDTLLKRFIWNYHNQVPKTMVVNEATNTWTYNSATFHQANAATGNKVEYVSGDTCLVRAEATSVGGGDSALDYMQAGIGIDATATNSAQSGGIFTNASTVGIVKDVAKYVGHVAAGYHYIAWLEASDATVTFVGDNNNAAVKTGLVAEIPG